MHFDLYRIESFEEIFELSMEEAVAHSLNLIEWPEIAYSILPNARLEINFINDSANRRALLIKFLGKHTALQDNVILE